MGGEDKDRGEEKIHLHILQVQLILMRPNSANVKRYIYLPLVFHKLLKVEHSVYTVGWLISA